MNGSDVNDLLIFKSVVETGSFVAGGTALGLSRSAAGKAVSRLEKRFSTRLLNRTTRALDLTEDGRILYAHSQGIQEALDRADRSIDRGAGLPRGVLRVAAPDAFGRRLVLPVVKRYLDAWPEVQVELSLSDRVSDIVAEGFDLAIRIGVSDPGAGLICRTLLRDQLVLCAAPDYLARETPPDTVEQMSRHDLLFHARQNQRLVWRLQEPDGTWTRVQGRNRLRLDSGEALRDAARAGMGIALLPEFLVGEDLEAGLLTRILPSINAGLVQVLALYPHKRLLDAKVRQFIDLLVKSLPGRSHS